MKLISFLRIFVAILFLISPIDILCEKIPKYSLENHDQRKLEENGNFIKVKYGNETTYDAKEFKNQYRQSIDYIIYKGNIVDLEKELTIKANTSIEIYFSKPVTSLYRFFSAYNDSDPNVEYISSIDLTHFDSSSLESLESTFYGCSSLKALDLSKLTSKSITNTNSMFYGCESLLYINMNNLDLSKVNNATYMFYNMTEINYLEIKGTKFNDKINAELKGKYGLNNKDDLMVCKNEENSSIGKHESICCDYNIELKKCNNYIICKFSRVTQYSKGFQTNYRNNIAYIKMGNSIFGPFQNLLIYGNTYIEIYFSKPTTSLSYFFSAHKDFDNTFIEIIDLSHFISSLVETTLGMVDGCSSLEEINFNNFDTSKVTDMSYMFKGCMRLKSLDLSKFYTSNVTEISSMFDGCNALEYLDLSNFAPLGVKSFNKVFADLESLKYINLYNAHINDDIKSQIEGIVNDKTIICQNDKIINKGKNDCSIFTPSDNYIRVEYGIETTYKANKFTYYRPPYLRFKYRPNIVKIKIGNSIIGPNETLIFEANTNIEIYFSKPILYLTYFFTDQQSKNIKLIDLSHFDSSLLVETREMFSGCSSLEEINFSNFDTSKVTMMFAMFNKCSKLKSLDLSSFYTSQVTDINGMFNLCSSLKYLDISNFNTLKSREVFGRNIFSSEISLEYINLYNAQISNYVKREIEKVVKDTTRVCQKDKIIDNGIKDCSIFNQYDINDNEFSFFESNNSSPFPEIKNEETNVVLLGFSQFRSIKEENFTFYIYLTATKNILYTKHIQFPMEITYNRNIRRLLKETKANCTLDPAELDKKYKYYCHVDEKPDNIKEAKLIPEFDFVSQDNVTLTGTTPLAKMFMNNMMAMENQDKYGNILENSRVYILDNSNFYKYDKCLFNITGEINDPQPKLDNKNLLLMINLENNDTIDIQCNISNITRNNYILHCKSNESFKGEIQSAVSFIDNNDILLLNFADIKESNIDIEATQNNRKFFIKKENKLGAGAIVGIIISILVVIALIAFIIFHLRKKNEKDVNDTNSSIKELKISDGIKH